MNNNKSLAKALYIPTWPPDFLLIPLELLRYMSQKILSRQVKASAYTIKRQLSLSSSPLCIDLLTKC